MKKILLFAIILIALSFILSANTFAQNSTLSNVTIINKTEQTINDLYFSIVGSNNWGFDVIPKDDFLNGETLKFKFDVLDQDHCNWDIQYVTADGKTTILKNIKLCGQEVVLTKQQ
jgi:hypothetical protein